MPRIRFTGRSSRRTGRAWAGRRLLVLMVALVLVAAACGGDDTEEDTSSPGTDTAGSGEAAGDSEQALLDIPESEVRLSVFPCCPDNNIVFVAMRQGFFEDVGIEIVPEPEGHHFSDFAQITPAMQRGDHDIAVHFIQGYLQTLNTFGQDIPPILFFDIFLGISILKAPDSDAMTALDFVDDGMSFPEAAAAAVEQLRGADIFTPPYGAVQPSQPNVYLSYADMTLDDLNVSFLDDPQIVELSLVPGRIEFAIPLGAGVVVQMIDNGWEPVISTAMILENDSDSQQAEELTRLVGSTGLIAQRSFVEENRETTLRFLSAVYRAMEVAHDPAQQEAVLTDVADMANATRGTDIDWENVAGVYDVIDPFFLWDMQGPELWEDPESGFHVPSALEVQVQALVDDGTLPDQDYDLDQFLLAEELYFELKDLQERADELFEQAEGVPEQAQGLVDEARTQYDRFNFLDAVRFLEEAIAS